MRIGTISLNINAPDFNYGAMLHSWAFQQYLLKHPNVESTEIIDYTMPLLEKQDLKHPVLNNFRHRHLRLTVKSLFYLSNYKTRWKKFHDFINKNMKVTPSKYTQQSLNDAYLPYDVIICESDVIWSHAFFGGKYDKTFFLSLDSMTDMRRIAYAPSMGDGDLNDKQRIELIELLKNIDFVSVRESYAVDIIQQLTNKPVSHVVDPVLLLQPVDYDKIAFERMIKENYILLYLPVDNNYELRKYARVYAEKYGYRVVEISTNLRKTKDRDVLTFVAAGIEEFLSLIKYSNCVFTNSFHAICFSILYNRQFYAFSRRCSGKVLDICKLFQLDNYYFPNDKFEEQDAIDFNSVNIILNSLRQKSEKWLEDALFDKLDK